MTDKTDKEIRSYKGKTAEDVPKHLIRYFKAAAPMVVWNITRKCNLSCSVCHLNSASEADKGELTTEEAKKLIDEMSAMGVPLVSVYGGEPLVRDDFLEIASYATEKGLRVIFSTNSTLISGKVAEKIKNAGLSYVGIDLDGLAQQGDNGFDVIKALDLALPAIDHLKNVGLRHGVRITVGEFNSHMLSDIILAVEDAGIRRIAICQLIEGRSWREIREERKRIMDFLIRYAASKPEMEVVTEHVYADGVYILERLKREDPERARRIRSLLTRQGGCPAGRKLINIDHLGYLHPCLYWKDCTLGNVRKDGLAALWNNTNTVLQRLRDRRSWLTGKCRKCDYSNLCGGCRRRAEKFLGDPFYSDPACYVH